MDAHLVGREKKGCGNVKCKRRLGLDNKGEPIANICLSANTNL
jgi:hypothetical protein